MKLRDVIRSDIEDVILQLDDFAEEINFDGIPIVGVLDTDEERQALVRETEALGSFLWDYRIFTKTDYFARRPQVNDAVRINGGEVSLVTDVEMEMGMLVIYILENAA